MPNQSDIAATLVERGERYGCFADVAETSQVIKAALGQALRDRRLAADQVEALEMIANKLARIVNGDSDFIDSWVDIAGYAKLVADRLAKS